MGMDPLQGMIDQEVLRRLGQGGSSLRDMMQQPGTIGGAARMPQPPPQPAWMGAVDLGLKAIPKVGIFTRAVNAGPVGDGTLDHARRMGWVR
jgi:hypothetical protein